MNLIHHRLAFEFALSSYVQNKEVDVAVADQKVVQCIEFQMLDVLQVLVPGFRVQLNPIIAQKCIHVIVTFDIVIHQFFKLAGASTPQLFPILDSTLRLTAIKLTESILSLDSPNELSRIFNIVARVNQNLRLFNYLACILINTIRIILSHISKVVSLDGKAVHVGLDVLQLYILVVQNLS